MALSNNEGPHAALDRQQVGAGRRLLHALRRHVRRAGGDQRRAEDAGLRPGAVREPRARRSFRASTHHQGAQRGVAARTRPIRTRCRPTRSSTRSIEGYVEKRRRHRAASSPAASTAPSPTSIIGRIDRNEYKRRQAAPGLKITLEGVRVGWRYPIAADYRSLGDLKLGEPVPEAARPGR